MKKQNNYPQGFYPTEARTTIGMSDMELVFHKIMTIFTLGLWYPFYLSRKHQAKRKAVTRYR